MYVLLASADLRGKTFSLFGFSDAFLYISILSSASKDIYVILHCVAQLDQTICKFHLISILFPVALFQHATLYFIDKDQRETPRMIENIEYSSNFCRLVVNLYQKSPRSAWFYFSELDVGFRLWRARDKGIRGTRGSSRWRFPTAATKTSTFQQQRKMSFNFLAQVRPSIAWWNSHRSLLEKSQKTCSQTLPIEKNIIRGSRVRHDNVR